MKQMLKDFVQTVKRYKSSTIINILGLSSAFAVFLIVLMQVRYDLTYDKSYPRHNDIYIMGTSKWGPAVNQDIPQTLSYVLPEVEEIGLCSAHAFDGEPFFPVMDGPEKGMYQTAYVQVTPGFMSIFKPEIVAGDTTDIFSSPGKGLISEKVAKKMFGNKEPIGQVVQSFMRPENKVVITAVYRDFPENSSLLNGIYTHLGKAPDSEWSFRAYFLINKNHINEVRKKINSDQIRVNKDNHPDDADLTLTYTLSNLNDIYLYGDSMSSAKVINTTLSLLAVGVIILLIAFINFFNFTLGMAPDRMKATNVRMVFGASKAQLRCIIAMHGVFLSVISMTLALILVRLFRELPMSSLFESDLILSDQPMPAIIGSLIILLLSFTVGWYGAAYTTTAEQTLKSDANTRNIRGGRLRNILITIQFIAAIVLISFSVFVKVQHNYMKKYSLGFDKENILVLYTFGLNIDYEVFGQELLQDPRVLGYAASQGVPGQLMTQWGRQFKEKQLNSFHVWGVDRNFMKMMNIKLIAGEYPPAGLNLGGMERVYPNKTFMKHFDFNENMVGESDGKMHIMGFIEDVNFQSLHEHIQPMVLLLTDEKWQLYTLFVKLAPGDQASTIEGIRKKWDENSSLIPFSPSFLDEQINSLYVRENNISQLIGLFGLLTILIAVMGIYGMILFITRSRVKEIGIRKVNGASVSEIIIMLNRNLLAMLGVAFIIAVPITLYAINKWLSEFAYQVAIPLWLLPGTLLFVTVISAVVVSWQSLKAARANPINAIKAE